ncbi:hypothetical protein [Massilia sp. TS11]|uniref:recombination directionality factor n=1 Tax=Massilia sp. TS11 TaxID=2908003 RepID=UPI001EDB6E70|nr:hypothetical protein [Massilia sp. TS11]MCG2583843.1 hypothetical protein [Massilia sp. TS11]
MTTTSIALRPQTSFPSVLGQRSTRIPTSGKIRAGIKVLTRSAENHPKARALYEEGVGAGRSFEEIEATIAQTISELPHPLVPKNVQYFTARPGDFPNPKTAQEILDAFGEDRGDGIKRLYRFPVIFPADVWQAVMPHELVAWGASERKFWSEYAEDGLIRYCKCYAPAPTDRGGKRVLRPFGGRKTQLRAENGGMCDPENCPEFQSRQCNLSGRFLFFIPGIRSLDAFELHTNSFTAMSRAVAKFQTLSTLCGGRLAGFVDGRTPFYLSKVKRALTHLDETGRAVRSDHWIIELEAPIDVAALLNIAPDRLEGETRAALDILQEPEVLEAEALSAPVSPSFGQGSDRTGPTEEDVRARALAAGVPPERFEAFADQRWGRGWKRNPGGRRLVLAELTRMAEQGGIAAEIEAVLGATA